MKVSIITATYNSDTSIADTIASLAQQGYPRDLIEWIVVDGASTDRTVSLVEESPFRPNRMLSEPDNGIYDALNKGIAMASGDVVGFLHADDQLASPAVLSRLVCAFQSSGAEAVYGDLQYVRKQGGGNVAASYDDGASVESRSEIDHRQSAFKVVRHWESGIYHRRRLGWGWMPPHPALYLKREVYERARIADGVYFDTTYSCAADYDFMVRLLSRYELDPVYLRMVLVKMRTGGTSNRSLKHILRKSKEDWRVIRQNRIGGIHTLVWKNLGKLRQFVVR